MQHNIITQKERLMMAKDLLCAAISEPIESILIAVDALIKAAGFTVEGAPEPEDHPNNY